MKKTLLFTIFLVFAVFTNAQEKEVEVGDTLTIYKPTNSNFSYVHFPRRNFIIKRGGIANMKSVHLEEVVVRSLEYKAGGKTLATLERADGGKFFMRFKTVQASLEKALKAGELLK